MMGKAAGTQDYFPALYGGVNVIEYQPQGSQWRVLGTSLNWIGEYGSVIYTGRAHHSGLNNWDVIQRALNGDQNVVKALHKISEISQKFLKIINTNDFTDLFPLFEEELKARLQLSPSFSSEEIEQLAKFAKSHGSALKICGAGGGGCVFVLSKSKEKKLTFEQQAQEWGYKVLPAHPWKDPKCPT